MLFCAGTGPEMRTVLIYRNELLPVSETFIQKQASELVNFRPVYIGLRRYEPSLTFTDKPILLCPNAVTARTRGMFYKATGFAPLFHRRAKRLDAALLHAHFAVDGANALPLVGAIQKPMVVTLHGNDVTTTDESYRCSTTGQIYLGHRQRLWDRASAFVCISDFLRRKALESGFPEHKLRTHYIGIDINFFRPYVPEYLVHLRKSVLFVARLVEKKGCTYLIQAMQQVQSRFPDARLVIIGDGPERSSLEAQARRLGVQCDFRGAQPSSLVRQEMSSARVFCVPSVTARSGDSEGLGIVFAEAQAMGLPVVSSLHGGIPEVVCNGATGLLAPERDHNRLAEHITRFFADETFWKDCSRKAQTWVADHFDIRRQTLSLEETYTAVSQSGAESRT
jgi:colanic acid/amylovoran biosynthesis glycosyltransferase